MSFKTTLAAALAHLKSKGIIKRDTDILKPMNIKSKGTVSSYASGKHKMSDSFREKFENIYSIRLSDFEDKVENEQGVDYKTKNPGQSDQDFKTKYITLLEDQIKEKDKLIQLLSKRLDEIEDGLVTAASAQQAWQEFWTEHIPLKKKMTLLEIKGIIRNKAFDMQQAFAKDGIQIV